MNLFLLKKIASTKIKQESTFLLFTNYVYEIYAVKAIFIMLSSTKTFFQTNKQMCGTLSIHMYIIEFLYSSSFYKINISRWGRILKFYHHREKNDTSNSLIFKLKKNHKLENLEDRHVLTSRVLSDNSHTIIQDSEHHWANHTSLWSVLGITNQCT